jgi:uncharacterized membrane protein YecN with MAPEG domain
MRARSLLLGGVGVVAAALVWWLFVAALPVSGAQADIASRLALGALSLLPASAVLAAMILAQMVVRFAAGTFDPTAGRDNRFLVVNQRVITNTVEQLACFAPALLALSAVASPLRMTMVAALGLTFAVARVAFWIGYLRAPVLRAPGMGATFVATVMAIVWAALGLLPAG